MDPDTVMKEARAQLIEQLNIGHLSEAEQAQILDGLSEVLMRRVMIKLMDLLPEADRVQFGELLGQGNAQEAQKIIEANIPNHAELVKAELKAGIDEHKRLVAAGN